MIRIGAYPRLALGDSCRRKRGCGGRRYGVRDFTRLRGRRVQVTVSRRGTTELQLVSAIRAPFHQESAT